LFFDKIGPLFRYLPVTGCRGNHDGEDALAKNLWPLPDNGQWTAMTWGNARVVLLDSNEHYPLRYSILRGGAQRKWLDQEMLSPEWRKALYRIVLFHHPHKTEQWDGGCYYGNGSEDPMLTDMVENSLLPGGANLILNGHAHSYQRGQWNSRQFHVISGGAGGALDNPQCFEHPHITSNPGKNNQFFHFLTLDSGPQELRVRCVRFNDRSVYDQFAIQANPLD
jgi:hypothetical protein